MAADGVEVTTGAVVEVLIRNTDSHFESDSADAADADLLAYSPFSNKVRWERLGGKEEEKFAVIVAIGNAFSANVIRCGRPPSSSSSSWGFAEKESERGGAFFLIPGILGRLKIRVLLASCCGFSLPHSYSSTAAVRFNLNSSSFHLLSTPTHNQRGLAMQVSGNSSGAYRPMKRGSGQNGWSLLWSSSQVEKERPGLLLLLLAAAAAVVASPHLSPFHIFTLEELFLARRLAWGDVGCCSERWLVSAAAAAG